MTTSKRLWLTALVTLLVLSTPTTALARRASPDLPPPPDWPIIGPILRWLGLEGIPEPAPVAFDPTYTEHRLTTIEDAETLWESLSPDERIRIIISQEDANAQLQEALLETNLLKSVAITFEGDEITLTATVERSALEREGVKLPFFILGKELNGEVKITLGAKECRPTLTIKKVRIGRISLPLRNLVQTEINKSLDQSWLPQICVERVFILPGEFAIEGYRR